MKKTLSIIIVLLLLLPILSFSSNKTILSKIKNAEKFINMGKKNKALDSLNEAILLIKNTYPLGIKVLSFIKSEKGFGNIVKKNGNLFTRGDILLVYIEPIGYKIIKDGNYYKIKVSQDAKIIDSKGKTKFERKDWVIMDKSFITPSIPFYITNRISNIGNLPSGEYTYEITINDLYARKFYKKSIKFIIKK
jgi:hypothetical protein